MEMVDLKRVGVEGGRVVIIVTMVGLGRRRQEKHEKLV
jgi:hypothetical protein